MEGRERGGVFIQREEERRQEAGSPVSPIETFMQKKGCPLYRGRALLPLGVTGRMKKTSAYSTGRVQQF